MTSEELAGRQAAPLEALADPAEAASPPEDADGPRRDRGRLNLTDPKAIRALAHPVRMALLEALGHAGTLTATQASEMLGESPANSSEVMFRNTTFERVVLTSPSKHFFRESPERQLAPCRPARTRPPARWTIEPALAGSPAHRAGWI